MTPLKGIPSHEIELVKESLLAIDTEFHSERRYHPELMLVQIANEKGDVWTIRKGLHEGSGESQLCHTHHPWRTRHLHFLNQDLEIKLAKLFDTQLRDLGLQNVSRLQAFCKRIIDLDISKVETLTDWSKRPLDEDQVQYVADDARVLFPLYNALIAEVQKRGLETYMWQACEEMVDQQLLPPVVGLSWIHWGVAETLSSDAQRVLTALLEWRELTAMRKNQSPNYILPRSILLYLAKAHPTTVEKYKTEGFIPRFSNDTVKKWSK